MLIKKREKMQVIGNKTHKCVTMKRATEDMIIFDQENNKVGYMVPETLEIIDSVRYEAEGYLKGSIALESKGKKYIYLWFSSGTIVLIDPLTRI